MHELVPLVKPLIKPAVSYGSNYLHERFANLFTSVAVKENEEYIKIEGINGREIATRITKLWKTSAIANHMFSKVTHKGLIFRKFFAVEVFYVLNELMHDRYLYSGTKALVKKVLILMKEETWLKSVESEFKSRMDYNQLSKFKKTPLQMQRDFLELYDKNTQNYNLNGFLLSAVAGSGKSLSALMVMACRKKELVIITCLKNNVMDPWVKTLSTEFKKPVKFWSTLTDKELEHLDYDYIVVHYEALDKILKWLPELKKKDVGIILDESHNFNEIKSDRTQKFVRLATESGSTDILPMSGTPVKAMATEMVPMLKAIDPLFVDDTEERFKKIFGVSTARANDIMRNRVGLISYRTEKSVDEYGELTEIEYKVVLPDADRYTLPTIKLEMAAFVKERLEYYKKNYKKYENDYNEGLEAYEKTIIHDNEKFLFEQYKKHVKAIRKAVSLMDVRDEMAKANNFEKANIAPVLKGPMLHDWRSAKSVVKYVGLKVRGEALGRLLGRRRAECHVEMIEHAQLDTFVEAATKKTLLFTSYVDVVNETTKYFKQPIFKNKYDPLPVTAETTKSLKQMLGRLEKDPKANPMIATYDSLSTGVPVTAASTIILFNQPFRSYEREQAIARAWRRGQDTPVTVVNVILDTGDIPNISTRSLDIMEWSKEQVEQITGVKLSGVSNNPTVGLEEFIDTEELGFMKEEDTPKTMDEMFATTMDKIDSADMFTDPSKDVISTESESDAEIDTENAVVENADSVEEPIAVNDPDNINVAVLKAEVLPSLEGLFDSAISSIKKVFNLIGAKDIDRERVPPFTPSRELYQLAKSVDYSMLADTWVNRPEGLECDYLAFTKEMEIQFNSLSNFFDNVMKPVNQYLATVASDPSQISSVRPGEFNLYLKKYSIDTAKQSYSQCFKDGNLTKAKYHQMIRKNEDWLKLQRAIADTQKAYLKISPEKVEGSVNASYEMLEDVIMRLKTDPGLLKVSKIQIKDLTTLAFTLAETVEYYSALLYVWRVFNQALRDTDKDLTSLNIN